MEPELAVVYSPREWANRVVRHITDHGGGRVRLRVVDGRVALEEGYDVLLAEDVTSFLTHRTVQELHHRGRGVLGVYDPEEPTGKERLLELGVDEVIEASASADEFVQAVNRIGRARPAARAYPAGGTPADGGLTGGRLAGDALSRSGLPALAGAEAGLHPGVAAAGDARREAALRRPRPGGWLWAVGGPPGGCGASEVAIELARHLRRRGQSVVLVDAGEVAPALAQRLGLPPIPNLRTAIDALVHGSGQLPDTLAPVPAGGFSVLAGLVNPADWAQVRAPEAADVAAELRRTHAHVVVNVGPFLEDLTRFGGPDRYGLTRSMIGAADVLVGVGLASPVGVARLLGWVGDAVGLAPGKPLHLAVNKAPSRGPAGRFVRSEVEAELRRSYEPASLQFLPYDEAVEKAAWRGELVAPGPFTRAVGDLVRAAAGPAPELALARRQRKEQVAQRES
ncbi:MAG TPA: hypothetical protein VKY26_08270 [Actinomycetota bacterium]|nr:hypothetical protein [Actinomycetota bacterium]